jgi:hypothetical protein
MIKAKSISNKFWILRNEVSKVGEISVDRRGYRVNIKDGRTAIFNTKESLETSLGVRLDTTTPNTPALDNNVHGFPAKDDVYNSVWSTVHNLPLYNKGKESKSWFAAGYYIVEIKNKWVPIFCPKLIILTRNKFHGPYVKHPKDNDSHQ